MSGDAVPLRLELPCGAGMDEAGDNSCLDSRREHHFASEFGSWGLPSLGASVRLPFSFQHVNHMALGSAAIRIHAQPQTPHALPILFSDPSSDTPSSSTYLNLHPIRIRIRVRVPHPAFLAAARRCVLAHSPSPAEGATKPLASVHLRLAQTFYLARLSELQTQIASYETQFTSLMSEISAIRSGGLDEAIRNEVRAVLARKYGKRLLDSWVPPVEDIRGAVEAGPVSKEEVKKEEEGVRAGMGTAKKDGETDKEKEQVDEKMEKERQAETVTTISEVTGEEQTEKVVDEGITEPAGEDVEMEQSPKQAGEEPEAPPAITAEPTVSLPSEEKEFAKAPTASPTKSSRSELSPAPGSPLSEAPDQVDGNEVEALQRGDKTEAPESSAKSPVAKEPEPEAEVEEREPETESEAEPEPEPEPETTTTRSRKRKASVPPKAPPAKRSGRRVASPVDTAPDTEAASEPEPEAMEVEEEGEGEGEGVGEGNEEAEVEADQEVEVEAEEEAEEEEEAPTTRGRRASKRHAPAKVPTSKKASAAAAAPESPSARTKDSSPAISRRAPSVSSTTSATPATAEERRSSRLGRGRHSDAASVVAAVKHREQSAAVESVKEEDGEQEDGEEKKTTRTSARRKGAAEVEVSTPVPDKRSKRGSIRSEWLLPFFLQFTTARFRWEPQLESLCPVDPRPAWSCWGWCWADYSPVTIRPSACLPASCCGTGAGPRRRVRYESLNTAERAVLTLADRSSAQRQSRASR